MTWDPKLPLRPWLSPHRCAHHGGCSAESGLVSREEPVPTAPTAPGLVPHVGAPTGLEAGPFLPAPGSEAPFWRGTVHHGTICDREL